MDIALLSMALSQANVQQQASMSLMKKALEESLVNADGLNKMLASSDTAAIQRAAQPHLGSSIDIKL